MKTMNVEPAIPVDFYVNDHLYAARRMLAIPRIGETVFLSNDVSGTVHDVIWILEATDTIVDPVHPVVVHLKS